MIIIDQNLEDVSLLFICLCIYSKYIKHENALLKFDFICSEQNEQTDIADNLL